MHILWRIVFSPFKWGWHLLNFIHKFILNVFLLIIIIAAVGIGLKIYYLPIKLTKGALVMDLTGTVVDKPAMNNRLRQWGHELLGTSRDRLQENSMFDVVDKLRQAKNDANITGLVLSLKNFSGADQASLQYIGKALSEFRASGKPSYAVGDSYSQAQYFLASYTNKIYLTPQGAVDLHGIATNNFYYKSLFDKLKINSHIFRVGTYKSAVEPFLRNNMSDAAREADSRWVGKLWQHYLQTVATNRHITPQQLFPGSQEMLSRLYEVDGNPAQFAFNNKWVDEVASRSAIETAMVKAFGWNKRQKDFNGTSMYDYHPTKKTMTQQQDEQIAVIFANGAIVDDPETSGLVGGNTISDQIRDARLDPAIKAIVFRINSPGGSISASEVIRSELAAARTAGKPVVVSMGGMAASGGYWISTPANYIIASDSTLTGSIGIFGVIHTVEGSLDSIGVHTDGVATSPLASMSLTKTLPAELLQMMQLNVENGYHNFLALVAQARHKTPEEIDKIGQGHVWIGSDAAQNGLVDALGDFDDAVSKAAELAQLKQYTLHWYLAKPGLMDFLLSQTRALMYTLLSTVSQTWLPAPVSQMADHLKIGAGIGLNWNEPQNRYAFCLSREQMH
ncbi:signal peptide peptidase SppA [Candidatus Hoaglandella endobia]|uniref:Protease 4 n=1 Tax=Candidatus Hoaglandella endobia TaxID=1778263 RepID=A0A143WTB6_9ENTR|nr:signal peptide peptidase SppA [Candidatus Hoaglandella endobia]CUX97000.1 Protease 4 [Candidatus Hoaglandella endobia]